MSRILYIKASPRGEASYSVRLADAFLREYQRSHPDDEVDVLDLFETDLPAFDAPAAEGKYAIIYGKAASEDAKKAWRKIEEVIARFKGADKYVVAVPMWNFGVPYVLKHYVDLVVQPTHTFVVGPNGYEGLLKGKRAFLAFARGGAYGAGTGAESMDHQKPYVEMIFGFMGITDVHAVVVEPTLGGKPEAAKATLEKAIAAAREVAKDF